MTLLQACHIGGVLSPAPEVIESTPRPRYWLSALVTALAILLFCFGFGCDLGHLYAPYPYHRLQMDALLEGRLSLSSSIERMDHGLTWHNGQVNQVWGLGVPLWMTPFELMFRLFGGRVFPDRLALLAAVALVAWYASRGGMAVAAVLKLKLAGICFLYLVLLFPPLWVLILGQQAIFEETILYACLVSTALLIAVVRFFLLQKRIDFWIACILGGLSGLVRVTHGVYGLMAGLLCGLLMLRMAFGPSGPAGRTCDGRKIRELVSGWTVLFAGFAFLAYSNSVRFGSMGEFGHRITNHTPEVIYLTRFGNPYSSASLGEAGKEFFSWLFLSPLHQYGSDKPALLPWQASAYRWRGVSQQTFDPSYLVVALVGLLGAAMLFNRRFRQRTVCPELASSIAILISWSLVSAIPLAAFYLYSPIITTRYILDFAPALLGLFLAVLLIFAARWPRAITFLLLAWVLCESMAVWWSMRNRNASRSGSREEILALPRAVGLSVASFHGCYTVERNPAQTGIKYNGQGWDAERGMALPIVTLVLDRPQFLEIVISPHRPQDGILDGYRAKCGGRELPIESTFPFNTSNTVVRFSIPEAIHRQDRDQMVFLCFATDWAAVKAKHERPLYQVRWRN